MENRYLKTENNKTMKYQVKCMHTDKVLFEAFSRYECGEFMEYEQLGMGDAWIDQVIPCRGCDNEGYEQYDAHGYGERLSDDY
jgi:hypothetical protein